MSTSVCSVTILYGGNWLNFKQNAGQANTSHDLVQLARKKELQLSVVNNDRERSYSEILYLLATRYSVLKVWNTHYFTGPLFF